MKKIYNMKKIIIISFIGLALSLVHTSCEEFLEEEPKSQIVTEQYYTDEEHAEATVNDLYSSGVPTMYTSNAFQGSPMMLGGYMSGLFDSQIKSRPGPFEAQNLTLNSQTLNLYMHNIWSNCYDAIAQANTAIKYIPKIDALSKSKANKLLAEAKFYRAWNYFFMVTNYGGVPLITEPYESTENLYVEASTDQEVYDQIINDLQWGIDNGGLPNVPFTKNGFRVSKGTVQTLLAHVYLQEAGYPVQADGAYSKAAEYAKNVINSGEYELIENGNTPEESAYNVIRTSDDEREYIYSYEVDGQERGGWNKLIVPAEAGAIYNYGGQNFSGYSPLEEFRRLYDLENDLRIQNHQFFYNTIEKEGETYKYNWWSPYLWFSKELLNTGRSDIDDKIYRYSEVLLIAAESIARSEGVTEEAINYLTDVRNRAYWKKDRSEVKSELEGLSEEQFVKEVWKERHRELALSFRTWDDIRRTRKYPVASESNAGEVNFVDVIGHTNPFGATYEEEHMLLPISETTLQRNPNLEPNYD